MLCPSFCGRTQIDREARSTKLSWVDHANSQANIHSGLSNFQLHICYALQRPLATVCWNGRHATSLAGFCDYTHWLLYCSKATLHFYGTVYTFASIAHSQNPADAAVSIQPGHEWKDTEGNTVQSHALCCGAEAHLAYLP